MIHGVYVHEEELCGHQVHAAGQMKASRDPEGNCVEESDQEGTSIVGSKACNSLGLGLRVESKCLRT